MERVAPRRLVAVSTSFASILALASIALGQATAPPATVRPATPPPSTAPSAPAGQAAPGDHRQPAHADDANSDLPEGLKVRAPGKQPEFKGGPAIYFEELDFDFGSMTNAETRSHRFNFVNAGDQPLIVEAVVPKCSCTRPKFAAPQTLQPGEKGFIDIDFTPPTGGHMAKAIMVKSNAVWPAPVWNIRVIGKVESVLSFTPKNFDFGEIPMGQAWEGETVITADAKGTYFDSVTAPGNALSAEMVGPAPHQGTVTLKLRLAPNVPWGSFRGGVAMLSTRGKNEGGADITKTLPFRVTGVVVDDIRANEYLMQVGTVRPGNSFTKSVFVYQEAGKPFELVDLVHEAMGAQQKGIVAVQYEPIALTQETRDGKPGFVITLAGNTPKDGRGFLGGTIRFKTRVAGAKELIAREIPIGGRVMTAEQEQSLPTATPRR